MNQFKSDEEMFAAMDSMVAEPKVQSDEELFASMDSLIEQELPDFKSDEELFGFMDNLTEEPVVEDIPSLDDKYLPEVAPAPSASTGVSPEFADTEQQLYEESQKVGGVLTPFKAAAVGGGDIIESAGQVGALLERKARTPSKVAQGETGQYRLGPDIIEAPVAIRKKKFEELSTEEKAEVFSPSKIKNLAISLNDKIPEEWKSEVGEVVGKGLSPKQFKEDPKGWLLTAFTQAGNTAPLLAEQAVMSTLGNIALPGFGAVTGGSAMMINETGNFLSTADDIGKELPSDQQAQWQALADHYAPSYGIASGLIEYSGNATGALGALKGQGSKTIQRFLLERLGGILGEGIEELSQEHLMNILMGKAIQDMKVIYPDFLPEWQPGDLVEAGLSGLVVGGILGAGGAVKSTIQKGGFSEVTPTVEGGEQTIIELDPNAPVEGEQTVIEPDSSAPVGEVVETPPAKPKEEPPSGITLELEQDTEVREDYEKSGLPITKNNFGTYWEEKTGEKLSREESREKIKRIWQDSPEKTGQQTSVIEDVNNVEEVTDDSPEGADLNQIDQNFKDAITLVPEEDLQQGETENFRNILSPDKNLIATIAKLKQSEAISPEEATILDNVAGGLRDANFNSLGRAANTYAVARSIELVEDGAIENFSMGMIDIGNLGQLNDVIGHDAANKVLQDLKGIVDKHTGKLFDETTTFGETYKQGGDEVGIVALNVSEEELSAAMAAASAEIDQYVESSEHNLQDFLHPKHDYLQTGAGYINYGVVDYNDLSDLRSADPSQSDAHALFVQADDQMYVAADEKLRGAMQKSVDKGEEFVYIKGEGKKKGRAQKLSNLVAQEITKPEYDEGMTLGEAREKATQTIKESESYECIGQDGSDGKKLGTSKGKRGSTKKVSGRKKAKPSGTTTKTVSKPTEGTGVTSKSEPVEVTEKAADATTLEPEFPEGSDEYYESASFDEFGDDETIISKNIAREYGRDIGGKYGSAEPRGVVYKKGQVSGRAQMRLQAAKKKADLKGMRDAALDYLSEKRIPTKDRGSLLVRLRDAITPKKMEKFYEAVDQLETKLEHRAAVKSLEKTINKIPKQLRPEYAEKIQGIAGGIDLSNLSMKKKEFLIGVREMLAEDPSFEINDKVQKDLERLDKFPTSQMTTEEIETINNELQRLLHNQKTKNKLIVGKRSRDYAKQKTRAIDNMATANEKRKLDDFSDTSADVEDISKTKKLLTSIAGAEAENIENIVERLSGRDADDPDNPMGQIFTNDIQSARSGFLEKMDDTKKDYAETTKGIDTEAMSPYVSGKKIQDHLITIPFLDSKGNETGETFTATPAQIGGLYNSTKNAHNMKNLFKNDITFDNTVGERRFKLTPEQVENIISYMNEKLPEVKAVADHFFDKVNSTASEWIDNTSTDLNGHTLSEEDHWRLMRTDIHADILNGSMKPTDMTNMINETIEGHGAFKQRKRNASGTVVIEDMFKVYYDTMRLGAAYSEYAKPLRSARQLLQDMSIPMKEHQFNQEWHVLDRWIKRVEGEKANTMDTQVGKLLTKGISNLYRGALGNNPVVIARQFFSYWFAGTEIDLKYLSAAAAETGTTKATKEKLFQYSPILKARSEGQQINLEMGRGAALKESARFFGDKKAWYKDLDAQTAGIRWADSKTIMTIYSASRKQIAGTTDLTGEEMEHAAARLAEKAVRRTQPTYNVEDRSSIALSENQLVRLATSFTSVGNKQLNVYKRQYLTSRRSIANLEYKNKKLQESRETANESESKIIDQQIGKNNAAKAKATAKFLGNSLVVWLSGSVAMAGIDDLKDRLFNKKTDTLTRMQRLMKYTAFPLYFSNLVTGLISDAVESGVKGKPITYSSEFAASNLLYTSLKNTGLGVSEAVSGFRRDDIGVSDIDKIKKGTTRVFDEVGKLTAGIAFKNLLKYTIDMPKAVAEKLSESEAVKDLKKTLPDSYYPPRLGKVTVDGKKVNTNSAEQREWTKSVSEELETIYTAYSSDLAGVSGKQRAELFKTIYGLARKNARTNMINKVRERINR